MALESLLTRLKRDVTAVTAVQPNSHAGLRCNGSVTADASDVTKPHLSASPVTLVTAAKIETLQPEPAWNKACTGVTAVTCGNVNSKVGFAVPAPQSPTNDPVPTMTMQPGLSTVLLTASTALDAQIQTAGPLPCNDADRSCWPRGTAVTSSEIDLFAVRLSRFNGRGVSNAEAEALADKLVTRDRDGDDRRLCLECTHLHGYGPQSWRCGAWQQAGVAIRLTDAHLPADLVVQLQRCDGFEVDRINRQWQASEGSSGGDAATQSTLTFEPTPRETLT